MPQAFFADLAIDISGIDSDVAKFSVWSSLEARWVWGGDGDRVGPIGFSPHDLVVCTLGTESSLLAGGPAEMAVQVASILQDQVIDRLGHGWPEISENGKFSELLQPGIVHGRPVWAGVRHSCYFGDLYAKYGTILDPAHS